MLGALSEAAILFGNHTWLAAAVRNGEFLPDLHRCGFMAESDDDNMHIKKPTRNS